MKAQQKTDSIQIPKRWLLRSILWSGVCCSPAIHHLAVRLKAKSRFSHGPQCELVV